MVHLASHASGRPGGDERSRREPARRKALPIDLDGRRTYKYLGNWTLALGCSTRFGLVRLPGLCDLRAITMIETGPWHRFIRSRMVLG